jgi:hypothetical protein
MAGKSAILLFVLLLAMGDLSVGTPIRLIGVLKGVSAGDQLGTFLEGIGDINGDGLGDILVGKPWNPTKTYLYLGGPHPFNSPPVMTINRYCTPLSVGDIDCDGVRDFIVSTQFYDSTRLYYGIQALDTSRYIRLFSNADSLYFHSFVVDGGGDNNNDGYPEFWTFEQNGWNDTIKGFRGCGALDSIPDFHIICSQDPDLKYPTFGISFSSTCDLNGDGTPDIVYGQYTGCHQIPYPGRVCIVWGGNNISQTADLTFYAPGMGALDDCMFGFDLACLGDISGDGIDDLWVTQGCRNYIFYGGRPFDTIPDKVIDYCRIEKIETIGDVNNDGWNDVALISTTGFPSQIAILYCGPLMDTLVDVVYTESDLESAKGSIPGAVVKIGRAYSWVGDVDGDKIDDILISGQLADNSSWDEGWTFVIAGWNGQPVATSDEPDINFNTSMDVKQNVPNPFNQATTIEFSLPRSEFTTVKVYNLLGSTIAVPLKRSLSAGEHKIVWDGRDLSGNFVPTGIYFYQVQSGKYSVVKKMALIK